MKLWLSKNSEVPMREQLITQITLGIASGDLSVGEQLPSRQDISRRFKIHGNTVSNAYKELNEQGLIEYRQGSGFYVNEISSEKLEDKIELDSLITKFYQTAQSFGFSNDEISFALENRINSTTPKSFLVIEPDKPLRKILIEEISQATNAKVYGISFADFENEHNKINSNFVALSDEKRRIDPILEKDKTCLYLKTGSVPSAMQGETRPTEDTLIAVVSGWKSFLFMAKTILVAAKIDGDSIIARSTDEENWKRGLESASIIICDSLTAKEFDSNKKVRTFRAISKDSIKDLQKLSNNNSTKLLQNNPLNILVFKHI